MITWMRPPAERTPLARAMVVAGLALLLAQSALAGTDGGTLPVARISIYPGETILAAMIEERVALARLREPVLFYTATDQIVGKVARRTILPGQGFPLGSLREADVVRAGKTVTLVYQSDGLRITGSGLAMQAGATGDVVNVQNSDSNVVVRGTVLADGTVSLGE